MRDGILLINKPSGITSRDAVNIISKKLNTKKVGHTGTLDPIASGLMLVCVNKGCKIVELLTNHDKAYIATVKMGVFTDTLDITGNVLLENNEYATKNDILKCLSSFIGEYEQEVPKYSAIKVNGKKLYEYARNNINVTLPKRMVNIYDIKLISYNDTEFSFYVYVSKGTYIRSLIKDIGDRLGILMTMKDLTRVKVSNFSIENSVNLDDISYDKLIRISDVLDYPKIVVDGNLLKQVKNGVRLSGYSFDMILFVDNESNEIALYKKNDKNEMCVYKMF